jgi:hypothetical protein
VICNSHLARGDPRWNSHRSTVNGNDCGCRSWSHPQTPDEASCRSNRHSSSVAAVAGDRPHGVEGRYDPRSGPDVNAAQRLAVLVRLVVGGAGEGGCPTPAVARR